MSSCKEDGRKAISQENKMTDEERLALSNKLDKDLDKWIDGLEKKTYTEGWAEDNWEEEMEKHPFFMTEFPEDSSKASPLLQGIQQLKYDETANSPQELARSYKEDGNFNFKHKNYRMSVISFTEGIRQKCGDLDLEASLYNNRAAAQFFLKNYRSSLLDCRQCLKRDAGHNKAELRAIQCCLYLNKADEALAFCESFLKRHPQNEHVKKLRHEARNVQKKLEKDRRKATRLENREENEATRVWKAVSERGVKVELGTALSSGDPLQALEAMHEKPLLLSDGSLTWPVFFLYPEFSTSDFIKEFNENVRMYDMLEEMFNVAPDWDKREVYKANNLNVYYEGEDRTQLYSVNPSNTLGSILKRKGFIARDFRPAFLVFVKESTAENSFLKNYSLK